MIRSSVRQAVIAVLAIGISTLATPVASAGFIVNPGTVFGGGGPFTNPSLTTLALSLYRPGTLTPIANTAMTATWYTPAGAVAGTTTFNTNATGGFTTPPPAIPAGALPNGGYVDLVGGAYGAAAPLRVSWYRTGWSYLGLSNGIHPLGLPGITPNQSWSFINPTETFGTMTLPDAIGGGTMNATVVDSNFDLTYSLISPGLYSARIAGNNSYMQLFDSSSLGSPELANNAFLAFPDDPDGADFGTIQYLTSTSGIFDFSAIGVSGTWNYDPQTNITIGTVTDSKSFITSAVAGAQVPEPSSLVLIGMGMVVSLGYVRRRRQVS